MIDFLTLGESRVQTIALAHMISNIVALTIFVIALALAVFWEGHTLAPLVLGVFGLLAVSTGGWLGGALVYEHGVGVEHGQPQEVAEPLHV
ncbi:MAG: hypothetical protein A2Y77_14135 [Planctomycetes bacterium RBG_13_62_9]|nr:MAG: hypothetical protein A2Y77_14135 [Planctomycetes bacterium RBG_13_62_9]